MKIVKTGQISRIFSDDLQTFDKLPAGNYKVCFNPMSGFYLKDMDTFKTDEKPYGKHPLKIQKVIKLYENIERSAGIILSGKKGMGKSMFGRLLSTEFAKKFDMPTIIVTEAYPGIVEFLDSIKQECVVLFDEFEKVFSNEEGEESQNKLLSLFDGISQTKRLYVVTVNELRKVNQYMINRPGRFHYHLQFNYPSYEEIALYLKDHLKTEYQSNIVLVQSFSNRFDLNYDSLRAIAFDLNLGSSFAETMEDLNISSAEGEKIKYHVDIYHSNGVVGETEITMNLLSSNERFGYRLSNGDYGYVTFSPLEIEIQDKYSFIAHRKDVEFDVDYDSDNEELTEKKKIKVEKLVFTQSGTKSQTFGKELASLM